MATAIKLIQQNPKNQLEGERESKKSSRAEIVVAVLEESSGITSNERESERKKRICVPFKCSIQN